MCSQAAASGDAVIFTHEFRFCNLCLIIRRTDRLEWFKKKKVYMYIQYIFIISIENWFSYSWCELEFHFPVPQMLFFSLFLAPNQHFSYKLSSYYTNKILNIFYYYCFKWRLRFFFAQVSLESKVSCILSFATLITIVA